MLVSDKDIKWLDIKMKCNESLQVTSPPTMINTSAKNSVSRCKAVIRRLVVRYEKNKMWRVVCDG